MLLSLAVASVVTVYDSYFGFVRPQCFFPLLSTSLAKNFRIFFLREFFLSVTKVVNIFICSLKIRMIFGWHPEWYLKCFWLSTPIVPRLFAIHAGEIYALLMFWSHVFAESKMNHNIHANTSGIGASFCFSPTGASNWCSFISFNEQTAAVVIEWKANTIQIKISIILFIFLRVPVEIRLFWNTIKSSSYSKTALRMIHLMNVFADNAVYWIFSCEWRRVAS